MQPKDGTANQTVLTSGVDLRAEAVALATTSRSSLISFVMIIEFGDVGGISQMLISISDKALASHQHS